MKCRRTGGAGCERPRAQRGMTKKKLIEGRTISKDVSKDLLKDVSKDALKDLSKDVLKDLLKDLSKDL